MRKCGVQGPQASAGVWGSAPSPVPQHKMQALRAPVGARNAAMPAESGPEAGARMRAREAGAGVRGRSAGAQAGAAREALRPGAGQPPPARRKDGMR